MTSKVTQTQYKQIPQQQEDTLSPTKLYLTMISFIVLGSFTTIILKIQDSVYTELDGKQILWHHPFVQTALMFFGESLCGVMYILYFKSRVIPSDKPKTNPLWFIIPASIDIMASGLLFVGLTSVAASVYQMMRGFVIICTAGLTITFLKRKLVVHHYIGVLLVIVGILFVGLATFLEQSSQSNQLLGLFLILLGQIFQSFHYVAQEYFFKIGQLHPFELIGWEGTWGLLAHVILLPLFYAIPCSHSLCSNGRVEDTLLAFQEITNNWIHIFLAIFLVIFISLFNGLGVTITKYASAAQRCIVDQSRVIFIWMFFLVYPGVANEKFRVLQLLGFIILVLGTLIYNEIWLNDKVDKMFGYSEKKKYPVSDEFDQEYNESLLNKDKINN